MRTISAGQQTDLDALQRQENVQVWVAAASGTLTDLSTYFLEGSVDETIDARAAQATITLQKQVVGTALAPLLGGTAVDIGREVTIYASVVEVGDSEDWQMIFHGYVDEIDSTSDAMSLSCRDQATTLLDTWVETPALYGNDSLTERVDTVMQEIIDAQSVAVTITTIGAPSFYPVEYTVRRQSLSDALQALVDYEGWDFRYWWDSGSSDFAPTFQSPPRTKTTLDHTFTTDDYYQVTSLVENNDDIRNAWEIQYSDGNSVVVTDATSISEFKRRYAYIDAINDPQITTSTIATAFGTLVLTDTAQPLASQSVEMRLFWPVQLGDLYRFPANGRHYTSAQDMAVTGFTHRFGRGGNSTLLNLRGTPSGGTSRWIAKAYATKTAAETEEVLGTVTPIPNTDTIIPTVEEGVSQSGSTGSLTLVVNDPGGYIVSTSFESFTDGGDFDFTTSPTGWSGYDASAPYGLTASVTLSELHNSFIAWAVGYDIGSGTKYIKNVVTLDPDVIPNLLAMGVHNAGANVFLSHLLDGDGGSIRYATSTTTTPSTAAVASGTVVAGRSAETTISTTMAEGDVLYVRARGFSDGSGGGTSSAEDWTGQVERPASSATPRPPTVQPQTDQSSSTGTLALVISDPDSVLNATAFEPIFGSGDFDLSTDPSTWTVYDTSAPYTLTDTVAISDKHNSRIGWAYRYDLGEGNGNVWVTGEAIYDADVTPNIRSVTIGFDDDGIPLVSIVADEDSTGWVYVMDTGSTVTPDASNGASTTLSGDEASGQTTLSVTSNTGFDAGNTVLIYDGTNCDVTHITGLGGGTITVSPALSSSYLSGANVQELEGTGVAPTEYSHFLQGQSGTVKQEASGSGPQNTLNVDVGEQVALKAWPIGANGLGSPTGTFYRRRGDTQFQKPSVEVSATRSGTDVSVTISIEDHTLAIPGDTSIDWRTRDGDDQTWSGYSSTWTSKTGTAGSATTLSRSKTVSDPDTAISWRITYTNENGDSVDLGDDIDLASVVELTKTMVVSPADFIPATSSENYTYATGTGNRGLRVRNTSNDNLEMVAGLTFPADVELTNITAYQYESGSGVATMYLYDDSTPLATINASGTGTDSASLSHTVVATKIYYLLFIGQNAATNETGVDYVEIDFSVPSFKQSY